MDYSNSVSNYFAEKDEKKESLTKITPLDTSVDDYFAEQQERDEEIIRLNMVKPVNPDQEAETLNLASETGHIPEYVKENREAVLNERMNLALDIKKTMDTSPVIAGLMKDQTVMGVIKDDIDNLSALEKFSRATGQQWDVSTRSKEISDIRAKEVMGLPVSPEELARLKELKTQNESAIDYRLGATAGLAAEGIGGLRSTWDIVSEAGIDTAIIAAGAGVVGAVEGALMTKSAKGATAYAARRARQVLKPAMGASVFTEAATFEMGLAFDEYIEMESENGVPMDRDVARVAAGLVGISNGIVETGFLGTFAKLAIPKNMIGKLFSRQGVKEMLKIKSVRDMWEQAAKTVAFGAAGGGGEEVIQETIALLGKNGIAAIQEAMTGEKFEIAGMGEFVERGVHAGVAGAFGGMALAGGAVTAQTSVYSYEMMKADRRADQFRELGKMAKDSKTRERMPSKFKEVINNLQEKYGTSDSVYIETEKLQTFFQTAGVTPEMVAKDMPELNKRLSEALQLGTEVAIPLDEFTTYIAPAEGFNELANDLRTHPETQTVNETRIAEEEIAAIRAEYEALMEHDEKVAESAQPVYDSVFMQLEQAGFPADQADKQAKLHQMIYANLAKKVSEAVGKEVTPKELYEGRYMNIQNELTETEGGKQAVTPLMADLTAIKEGKFPTDEEMYGESVIPFIRRTGGIREDTDSELRARDMGGAGGIIRKKGLPMSEMVERVRDAGYGDFNENELYDIIGEEGAGLNAKYAMGQENETAIARNERLTRLAEDLEAQGIDINEADIAEVDKIYSSYNQAITAAERDYGFSLKDFNALPEEIQTVVLEEISLTTHPELLKANMLELNGTSWAQQVIEGSLTRRAMKDMLAGNEPSVPSKFSKKGAAVQNMKADIMAGGIGALKRIATAGMLAHPLKPDMAINESFMECEPSRNCATYCYATESGYPMVMIRAEITSYMIEHHPEVVAESVAREFKGSIEYLTAKNAGEDVALRMFERGDGNEKWLPFYDAMEKQDVRLHTFSKRPEFLRQISSFHLNLLSGDISNHELLEQNLDLNIAYVFDGSQTEADWLNTHSDSIQMVLPIRIGQRFLNDSEMSLLDKEGFRRKVCPPDEGTVSLKHSVDVRDQNGNILGRFVDSKTAKAEVKAEKRAKQIEEKEGIKVTFGDTKVDDWRCARCDVGAGIGCYKGKTTKSAFADRINMSHSSIYSELEAKNEIEKLRQDFERLASKLDSGLRERLSGEMDGLVRQIQATTDNARAAATPEQLAGQDAGVRQDGQGDDGDAEYNEGGTARSVDTLYQNEEDVTRGYIQVPPNKNYFNITLTKEHNMSTFLHESGHMYLEIMQDLVARGQATDKMVKDLDATFEYLGAKAGDKLTRDQHETFARSFEAYLMEGKAPTPELREAFRAFKVWLTRVYTYMRNLKVKLTPEIREVFDRLIASDEEIEFAMREREILPALLDVEGLTEGQKTAYAEAYARTLDVATEEVDNKLLMELVRAQSTEQRKYKAELRKTFTEAYNNLKEANVRNIINRGKSLNGDPVPEGFDTFRLNAVQLKDLYPAGISLNRYTAKNGNDIYLMANLFEYASVEEMITAITTLPNKTDWVNTNIEQAMVAKFGDMMNDGGLEKAVDIATHKDSVARFLQIELKMLSGRKANLSMLREFAKDIIAKQTMATLQPYKYRQAEIKLAKLSAKAAAEGDFEASAKHKEKQMLNFYLYRESVKARDEILRKRNKLNTYSKKSVRENLGKASGGDYSYLAAIDTLLEGIDFKKATLTSLGRRGQLNKWIKEQEDAGLPVPIDDRLRDDARLKNYKEMTLDEIRGLYDAVKHIDYMARNKKKLLDAKNKRDFDEVVDGIVENIRNNIPAIGKSGHRNETFSEWAKSRPEFANAYLSKVEFLAEWADGDNKLGWVHQNIFQPFADAQTNEYDMFKQYGKPIMDLLAQMPKSQRARLQAEVDLTDTLGTKFKKHELLAVFLNLGNESNRYKMIKGEKWENIEDRLEGILYEHLEKEDLDLAQQIWDNINELWPSLEALAKRVTGIAPPKVEAAAIETPYGTYRGGYYPVVYDSRLDTDTQNKSDKEDLMINSPLRVVVSSGSRIQREEGYARPFKLSLDVIPQHLHKTIHDISHTEAVQNVNKILKDKRVQTAIREHMGDEYRKQLDNWIQNIANERSLMGVQGPFDGILKHLRIGTSLVAMGFKMWTGIAQTLGLFTTMDEIGVGYTLNGMTQLMTSPIETWKQVNKESGEMRHIAKTFDREVRAAMDSLVSTGKFGKIKNLNRNVVKAAFMHIAYIQKTVNMVTWLGAKKKFQNENPLGSDQDAVNYADSVMRMTQSAAGAKDMAGVQMGHEGVKLITMFYTYFSVLYNRQRLMLRNMKSIDSMPRAVASLGYLIFLPVMAELLMKGKEPEDDEDLMTWFFMQSFLYSTTSIPLFRDIANGALSDYGYTYTPVEQLLKTASRVTRKVAAGEADEIKPKDIAKLAGVMLHLPTDQPMRTLEFFMTDDHEEPIRDFLIRTPAK